MADGHVSHHEGKADPWHVRARAEEFRYAVGAACADEECQSAAPEIEEADKVKDGGPVVFNMLAMVLPYRKGYAFVELGRTQWRRCSSDEALRLGLV